MSKARRFIIALAFALSWSLSLQAIGASAAPSVWKSVDVTLHSDQQQSMLLVSGELPPDATLPATAELAVPAGTQLQWIGELLGGDPSKDPELTYTRSSAEGMDVYRFTLTKARTAQVEGIVPTATSSDGTAYVTSLKWTAWQTVPEVRISQRVPQAAQIVRAAEGASLQPGDAGYGYYTKTVKSPKRGDVLDLSFSYNVPAASPVSAGGSGAGGDTMAIAIVAIIFVGGLGLLFWNVSRKLSAKVAVDQSAPAESPARTGSAAYSSAPELQAKPRSHAEPVAEATAPKKMKPAIAMLVVVGVFIAAFAIAGTRGTSPVLAGGKISRDFGAPSACQSASLGYSVSPGVDLAQQGDQLLKGFEGMEGVGEVTIDLAQSKIDMEWCESSQSEDTMRQVLSGTGLITLGEASSAAASAPTTATVDGSGKTQSALVDTSSGIFAPSQLVLKVGVPAELTFGQAAGCVTEVVIGALGVNQDLTDGPTTVKLPALQAGTYDFSCEMGHQSGQLIVQ